MKFLFNFLLFLLLAAATTSCGMNRVETNNEGVLMTNYGRSKDDFKPVTGAQGWLGPGSELYQVPMYEQTHVDVAALNITSNNGGKFTVDPTYSYQPMRGKGVDIIFSYKQVGLGDDFMTNIQTNILSPLVLDTYREEARKYSTDYLIKNMGAFEAAVQDKLATRFTSKYFTLTNLTSGLTPPESLSKAIESTNNAVQEVEQVKNQLAVAKMEQEKARIERETNIIRSQGLTKEILQEAYIDAILRSENRIIITDGKTPVMLTQ